MGEAQSKVFKVCFFISNPFLEPSMVQCVQKLYGRGHRNR
jgi:hypothetical protein